MDRLCILLSKTVLTRAPWRTSRLLTELVVASIAGGDAAAFFESFNAEAQAKLTAAGISAGIEAVELALTGVVDLEGVDPLKDNLVAANGTTTGNALDQKLDALGEVIASAQTSLAELSTAITSNPGAPAPVQTILQPAAANCASLRSGVYHQIDLTRNHDERVRVDAAALTMTWLSDEAQETLVAGDEKCLFTIAAGTADVTTFMVAPSGIVAVRKTGSETDSGIMFPEQSIAVSELAGDWVGVGFEASSTG